MHLARRTAQPDGPHAVEAVHPAFAGLLQEAGEFGSRLHHVHGLLQLLLANPGCGRGSDPVAGSHGCRRVRSADEL